MSHPGRDDFVGSDPGRARRNLQGEHVVALVRPARLLARGVLTTNNPVPALALAYLAGALQAAGFATVAIDACGEALDQCVPLDDIPFLVNGLTAEETAARVPDGALFVAVSCMFSCEWYYHKRVIEAVRRRLPQVPILVGGEHVTADPEAVLRDCPAVTACGLGEGEETIVAVATALRDGAPLTAVDGLVVRAGAGAQRTAPRRRVRAIDALPWPAWDGLPLQPYIERGFGMDETGVRAMPMLASRGCPYQCTFCSSPQMWTTAWLARDPDDVVREIAHYVARYGIDHVEFYDLTTVVDRRWILRFTTALHAANLGITWTMPSGTRSEALDAEVLAALRRSGCRGVTYAPESGSPDTLRRIRKRVRPERMLTSIRAAVGAGMYVKMHLIVGLPGQTRREVWESFRFMLQALLAGVHDVLVYPFNPYPGSVLYAQLVAAGRLPAAGEGWDQALLGADYADVAGVRSWSEHLSAAAVRRVVLGSMLVFYAGQFLLRPWRAAAFAARVAVARPNTWCQRAVATLLRRRFAGRYVPARS